MTENSFNSSQESLPMSQETFDSLMSMMNENDKGEFLSQFSAGNWSLTENAQAPIDAVQPHPNSPLGAEVPVPSPRSSLPATCSWPGVFDFQLLFGPEGKVNKNTTWAYSPTDNKLYVQKDVLCPFSFKTNTQMTSDMFLRATAVYTSPEHASTVVHRCVNHSQKEILQGIYEAEHLIRSDSQSARYYIDPDTKRHSVILPYENPPVGQDYSTYIFKFACFSSCAGGPNRRALTLIFTLEHHGCRVMGRIALDLKICACPGRDIDRTLVDKGILPKSTSSTPEPKKLKTDSSCISAPQNIFENFPKKKKSQEKKSEKKEEFIIRVKDVECYNFLMSMKKMFIANRRLSRLQPDIQTLFYFYKSSSSEDENLS